MGSLRALYESTKSLDMNVLLDECIEEKEGLIIGLNTRKQLFDKGIDAMGHPLEPPYAGVTKAYKRRKGQPVDRVTLKDKGDFYEGFYTEIERDFIQILSSDNKTPDLMAKYGVDIIGLTKENTGVLAGELKLLMQRKLRQRFGI